MTAPGELIPMAMLAELTHRCPMQCLYCSNPVQLEAGRDELATPDWRRVFTEAAALGVLQLHLSGGEPALRRDLVELVAHANAVGLFTNLITSGLPLNDSRVRALAGAGLEHVQLSIQDSDTAQGDSIGGVRGAQQKKYRVAEWVHAAALPLTINVVMHRRNLARLDAIVRLAESMGAQRLEVAHAQYYGWALQNRNCLMPDREQLVIATRVVETARQRLQGKMLIDYVVPDYYARYPKACMGGWARRFFNVSPSGKVLPCHAAETIPGMQFDDVRSKSLEQIWRTSEAFQRFRGTDWMPAPCRECDRREIDWGGCRCQALAITGDAANTDPACHLSPHHEQLVGIAENSANVKDGVPVYRGTSGRMPAGARQDTPAQ